MANTPKSAESNAPVLAGVLGFFDSPNAILAGMEKVRDANYQHFDAFTPFPIHGMDAAQGLKRSPLPYVTLVAGITGCSLAFLFQYWTSAVDWALIVGGKPFNSWPAWVPVMFELTVLFAGLSTVAAMFAFNGLPNIKRKVFDPAITRDRFAIVIEAPLALEEDLESEGAARPGSDRYKRFDEAEAMDFLKKAGAVEVRKVYAEGWF